MGLPTTESEEPKDTEMKVAYNAILLGNYFSGVEVTISTLGKMLSREMGKDLNVFLNKNIEDKFAFPEAELHPIDIPLKSRTSRIHWEHFKMPGLIKKLQCDILHCPGYIAPMNPPCTTVLTVHDTIAINHPELCKRTNHWYYKLLLGRSVKNAAQIIVPSETVKNDLVKLYNPDPAKINVIPFAPSDIFKPVDDEEQLKKVREKYKLPDKFILFLANHEPKKNIPGIFRAFAEFKNKCSDYKLVLAGRKAWGNSANEPLISNMGIEKEIIQTGYVPIEDLSAIYSLADVFLFPSLDEGFGIPVLEAMACGTPVLCSDRGALPETTGGAAICVPPDNYSLISEKLIDFVESPELQQEYIQKGFERVEQFSWEKTTKETLEIYKKALK